MNCLLSSLSYVTVDECSVESTSAGCRLDRNLEKGQQHLASTIQRKQHVVRALIVNSSRHNVLSNRIIERIIVVIIHKFPRSISQSVFVAMFTRETVLLILVVVLATPAAGNCLKNVYRIYYML